MIYKLKAVLNHITSSYIMSNGSFLDAADTHFGEVENVDLSGSIKRWSPIGENMSEDFHSFYSTVFNDLECDGKRHDFLKADKDAYIRDVMEGFVKLGVKWLPKYDVLTEDVTVLKRRVRKNFEAYHKEYFKNVTAGKVSRELFPPHKKNKVCSLFYISKHVYSFRVVLVCGIINMLLSSHYRQFLPDV